MTTQQLRTALDAALADRQLLDHPFYRRWEAGLLGDGELAAYAGQYRHFEAALPGLLRSLLERLDEGAAATLVRQNLADELGRPLPHVELFEEFAVAAGADPSVEATPATLELLATHRRLVEAGPVQGLAGVTAYEMQAPAIAASKAEGLRRHHGMDSTATRFWDVHSTMDQDHADWAIGALAEMDSEVEVVACAAREAAGAWWAFLDEREAQRSPALTPA